MLLSRTCIYAIRALLLIASKTDETKYNSTKAIAEELDISFHFLAKITHTLSEAKLLKSYRGPNGGVGLARPANEINLIDIINVTDGLKAFEECLLGLPQCSPEKPCPLHATWTESKQNLLKDLQDKSLMDIVNKDPYLRLRG